MSPKDLFNSDTAPVSSLSHYGFRLELFVALRRVRLPGVLPVCQTDQMGQPHVVLYFNICSPQSRVNILSCLLASFGCAPLAPGSTERQLLKRTFCIGLPDCTARFGFPTLAWAPSTLAFSPASATEVPLSGVKIARFGGGRP